MARNRAMFFNNNWNKFVQGGVKHRYLNESDFPRRSPMFLKLAMEEFKSQSGERE